MTKYHTLRLHPADDLKISIQDFVERNKIMAGWIVTCVGSLVCLACRFANQKATDNKEDFMEILSLTGTISANGSHLHISVADGTGNCFGGHLMNGSLIYTTAEIILAETDDVIFERKRDEKTGFRELHF